MATKACHTCRRRRLRCDKGLPVCQKCLSSNVECLGYGKLFLWNQGVASRGKMMGKTFPKVNAKPTPASTRSDLIIPPVEEPSQRPLPVTVVAKRPNWSPTTSSSSSSSSSASSSLQEEKDDEIRPWLSGSLIDPLIKDLDPVSRYYMFHFATQLCEDLVVHDLPGRNPMRDLIPAIAQNPLLLYGMLSNSALHVYNLTREPIHDSIYEVSRKPCMMAYYRDASRFGGPFKSAYRDALVSKQKALALLTEAIPSINAANVDLVFAAIMLLINYELIESGKDSWKIHVEGAKNIIQFLGNLEEHSRGPSTMSVLRTSLISDSLVFCILGSTLSFSGSPRISIPPSIDFDEILRYTETNNYLSCPAPLIRIMLQSFELSDLHQNPNITQAEILYIEDRAKSLVEATFSFDPVQWASTFHPAFPTEDVEKRIRIASAHRSAVCLFVVRTLPETSPLFDIQSCQNIMDIPSLVNDIIHHLSFISPGDAVFKSICWPAFLAGAETELVEQRIWVQEKLDLLWNHMQWGYVRTAQEVLEIVWKCKERVDLGISTCWVAEVKRTGIDFLIA